MVEFSYLALFLIGLLGGGHCVGMCGGILAALSANTPSSIRSSISTTLPLLLAYNLGRIISYAVIGGLAGSIAQFAGGIYSVQILLYIFADLMLIALGLYLMGITQLLLPLETLGAKLWRQIQPLTVHLIPVTGISRALGLGMLWGWLPCGLVYSALVSALATGSAIKGASAMFAFGLGTLPNLLLVGIFFERYKKFAQSKIWRVLAGIFIITYGVFGLYRLFLIT